ncbi:MAG: hypothetical protein AB7H90_03720 [Alphaproteobacteria bacterium]
MNTRAAAPLASIIAVSMGLITSGAAGEVQPQWKMAGNWDIRIDKTLNYGCFMFGVYEGGDVLRVGFNRKSSNGYLLIGNSAWKSIEPGKEYELEFQIDSKPKWRGNSKAIVVGDQGVKFLNVPFRDANFLTEFAVGQTLIVRYRNKAISTLRLTGTYAAMQELLQCQRSVEENRPAASSESRDPFASADSPDPFAPR